MEPKKSQEEDTEKGQKKLDTVQSVIEALRGKDSSEYHKTLQKHLDRAYAIREFEIDQYWKKATYFWGFLIASFTAFFIVSDPKFTGHGAQDNFYELLVICIGCIFSFSWYLVNRASLYWQMNTERKIDTIEEGLGMPYYKIHLSNTFNKWKLTDPFPFTISKINNVVSLFISVIWLFLGISFFFKPCNKIHLSSMYEINFKELTVVLLTLAGYYYLFFETTFKPGGGKSYSLQKRMTSYKPKTTK